MRHLKIFLCKKCRTLDYAEGSCLKCGSTELDEANMEFLIHRGSSVQGPAIPVLWTDMHFVEKIGWN